MFHASLRSFVPLKLRYSRLEYCEFNIIIVVCLFNCCFYCSYCSCCCCFCFCLCFFYRFECVLMCIFVVYLFILLQHFFLCLLVSFNDCYVFQCVFVYVLTWVVYGSWNVCLYVSRMRYSALCMSVHLCVCLSIISTLHGVCPSNLPVTS